MFSNTNTKNKKTQVKRKTLYNNTSYRISVTVNDSLNHFQIANLTNNMYSSYIFL